MTQHQRSHGQFLPTYATLVGLPALALLVILRVGNAVVPKDGTLTTPVALPVSGPASHTTSATSFDLPLLLVQIIVILVAARLTGALVRRLGQPQVVGEMIAGIALGPSVLGAQAPQVAALLFPAGSLAFLNTRRRLTTRDAP